MSEVSRITDHSDLPGDGRERGERADRDVLHAGGARAALLYDLVEAVTGARLTVSWCRVGGIARDLPEDFGDRIKFAFKNLDAVLDDCDKLLSRNRIFIEPMSGIGKMSKEDAISYGLTARARAAPPRPSGSGACRVAGCGS